MIPIVILGAGASRRMGGDDKLLREIDGLPLLARVAGRAVATGAAVFVALPRDDTTRRAALADLDVTVVDVAAPDLGMSASLKAGVAALPATATGVLLVLGDMPDVDSDDLSLLLAAFERAPDHIHRAATATGKAGHPVALPREMFPEIMQLEGDAGARSVLQRHAARICTLPLPGDRAITDLDTPQDWARWQNARRGQNPKP